MAINTPTATAAEAFEAARVALQNDPNLAPSATELGKVVPSDKFLLNSEGENTPLPQPQALQSPIDDSPLPTRTRSQFYIRKPERFVGRQREMVEILQALVPRRAGQHDPGRPATTRAVTLTKEGGIGKTALLCEIIEWVEERRVFPGGIFEISAETLAEPGQLLAQLLVMFGVPPAEQRGDLMALLAGAVECAIQPNLPSLLVIDNLDDLCGQQVPPQIRDETLRILETCLRFAPELRLLAACRWPLGLSDFEIDLEIPPMQMEEACALFLAFTDDPAHRFRIMKTARESGSPVRQLVELVGGHPQSIFLLARQLRRKGITIEQLLNEARQDLLPLLQDPHTSDSETDRRLRAEISFALSYRHLSQEAKILFQRLAFLPAGIFCLAKFRQLLPWEELLGQNWRELLEQELDYFALVHFDRSSDVPDAGTFSMLPSVREFALKLFANQNHEDWKQRLYSFWAARLRTWDHLLSGRAVPLDDVPQPIYRRLEAGSPGRFEQYLAASLFNLAKILHAMGKVDSAIQHLRKSLEIYCRLAQSNPRAFEKRFGRALDIYVRLTQETSMDPWWQLYKEQNNHPKAAHALT